MTAPIIAAYALDALGPANIATNLEATKAGWTTILLGLFHIGYPPGDPPNYQTEAEIFFNSTSMIKGGKDAGTFSASFDPAWPQMIAALKENSPITRIHASFGGGSPVVDFTTIKTIFEANNNELRACAARSRRRSSVGRTRDVGRRLALWGFHRGRWERGLIIAARRAWSG